MNQTVLGTSAWRRNIMDHWLVLRHMCCFRKGPSSCRTHCIRDTCDCSVDPRVAVSTLSQAGAACAPDVLAKIQLHMCCFRNGPCSCGCHCLCNTCDCSQNYKRLVDVSVL